MSIRYPDVLVMLGGSDAERLAQNRVAGARQPSMPIELRFALTDHVCRACLGRILERNSVFMCSCCEAAARHVDDICGCGMRAAIKPTKGTGRLPPGLEGAYRCAVNTARTMANTSRIVIICDGHLAVPIGDQ